MVQLVQVVFARKQGPVTEHLGQDAAHRPHVNGFGVTLRVQHDFGCTVPPGGYVLSQESCVVMVGISNSCKAKITDLQETYSQCMS